MSPSPGSVYRRLLEAYGPQGWWPVTPAGAGKPVYRPGRWGKLTERQRAEVCVGAILTQNTNWGNVTRALAGLHGAGLRDLRTLREAAPRRVESLVRPSGYFRQKTKKLRGFARHAMGLGSLRRWLSGPLAALREELLGLWGVGPETADSILLYAGGRPVLVVDAYTIRIGRRLGWFKAPSYAQAQEFLMKKLPASARLYGDFHALLVALAKAHCRTQPLCRGCPLLEVCRHGRKILGAAR